MGTVIKVANMFMQVKGTGYFKNLTPVEHNLLSYFIVHGNHPAQLRNTIRYSNICYPHNLRLLFRLMLTADGSGIMLHASSLDMNGRGYVFMGRSGAGKSTVANLLKPCRILSDDTAVIRKIRNKYEIFANPWWNKIKHVDVEKPDKPVSLKAIFFIRKSKRTSIKRINYKTALAELIYGDSGFKKTSLPGNEDIISKFYIFCSNLTKDIPCFELKVRKWNGFNKEFGEMVNSCLK